LRILKIALLVVGILALVLGLIWVGQGTGHFPYPSTSFMIDQTPWAYRGAALLVAGIILIGVARRI